MSSRNLRWILVQGAQVAVCYPNKLQKFYYKLARKIKINANLINYSSFSSSMGLVDKLGDVKNRIILQVKRMRNRPDSFTFVQKDNDGNYVLPTNYASVSEVGEPQDVVHLTVHDMMPHAVMCKMTDLKYLNGQDANAVYVDHEKFERLDDYKGRTYFQPLKLNK